MENLTIRVITSSSVNAYVMIDDTLTLCTIKFESINTQNGQVTYIVTPNSSNEVLSARIENGVTTFEKSTTMSNVVAYKSVKDYEHDVRIEEELSLENFLNGLHSVRELPASLVKFGAESEYAFRSYKFVNGDVEEIYTYFPIIYADIEKNKKKFVNLYKTREETLAWHDIKVSENGTETIKEGILKALSLTDEQKALVEEFVAMKEKLNKNDITIIYNNDDCSLSFVNTSKYDLDNAYNKEEICSEHKEDYEEVSYLLNECLTNICSKPALYDVYEGYDNAFFVRK